MQLTGSITVGYDDNVNQTGDGPGEERLGSGFTSIGLSAAMQGMGRLQLFSMTASAGADLYWNQEDPDYHFDLGLVYHRQLVAPAEVTANLRLAYLSRPDYAQVNLVASDASDEGGTNYFLADARATYEYHWTAQFSTATSISANAILYQGNSTDPSYTSYTVGQEARYRTGRFTWIAEGRYSQRQLLDLEGLDSSTVFALLGTEWRLGPWVHVSARGGAELRDAESGGRSSSPYGELGINFQPDLRNRLALVARYGFEFDDLEGGESETFRAGLTYTRTFGPRFTGTLAANFSQSSGGEGASAGEDLSEGDSPSRVTLACFLTLNYRVSTRLSLSASVSSTHSDGEEEVTRNRLSLSANYHF